MIKLLNAGFTRLRKSKMFWLLSIFNIGFAFIILFAQYNQMVQYNYKVEIEQILLDYAPIIGIVIAIFISLFLGVEYSDGGIRNKISIGHKRETIYLSNFLLTILTSFFSYFLFSIIVLAIGIPLFGGITIPFVTLLLLLGCILVTIVTYCSIFTFLAMLIANKTITAVVSILLAFGLVMTALTCLNILNAPPTIQQAIIIDGETKMEQVPNPKYPSERKKKVLQTMLHLNPTGQMFQIAEKSATDTKVLLFYSLGTIVVFTGVGLVLFKKKELK